MAITATLTHVRSHDGRVEVHLDTDDGPVTVPLSMSPQQAHALRHQHAAARTAHGAPDVATPTDLLVSLLARHDLAPHAIEVTHDRRLLLRYGQDGQHTSCLNVVDGIALLLRGELPVLVDLPTADADWDTALAGLGRPAGR